MSAGGQTASTPALPPAEPKAKAKPPAVRIQDPASAGKAADKAAPKEPKKDAKKKEDEIGKIDGMEIARGGNRYLGIQIVGGKFKLSFYDAKKKPVSPDVARAALRWDPRYKLGMERVVLTPGGGPNSLTAEKFVRPPYNFKLTIVLLGEAAGNPESVEPAGETYVIDFRQQG